MFDKVNFGLDWFRIIDSRAGQSCADKLLSVARLINLSPNVSHMLVSRGLIHCVSLHEFAQLLETASIQFLKL